MQSKTQQICILGSANFDYFLECRDFPKEGETIAASNLFTHNGGKGANQAVAAARLLGSSLFAGQVGKDSSADNIVKEMEESGVNLKYLRRLSGVPTGQAFILLNEKGENCIIIVGGANTSYADTKALPQEYKEAIDACDILLLQKEIPLGINLLAAKYAKEQNKIVVQDCGGQDVPFPDTMLNYIDYLSPNETELSRLVADVDVENIDIEKIRSTLLTKHPNLKILLKLGSKGCAILTKSLYTSVPVVTKYNDAIMNDYKIVDTTGAGDCFTASFFVKYLEAFANAKPETEEEAYKKCMNFANTCAFLCITQKGAMPSNPNLSTVKEFIAKYLPDLLV